MRMFRSLVVTLMLAALTGWLLPASSSAASPSNVMPDYDAAIQHAGQPGAVKSNPHVSVPQDARSAVAVAAADGSTLQFTIPAQGAASVQGDTVVFEGGASNSVALQRTADGVRALVGMAGPGQPNGARSP